MSDAASAIAKFCGELLARGVPAGRVLAAEARLRRLAKGGMAGLVEFPEFGLACRLPPARGACRMLHRPGSVG